MRKSKFSEHQIIAIPLLKAAMKESRVKDFCEFVDQGYMKYAKCNKAIWKYDLFRSEKLKEPFLAVHFRDITPRSVEILILGKLDSDSRRKSKRSPVSVHKEFSLLSLIFNMAMREEVAACNPCLKISKKLRDNIPARNKFMSLEESDKLFNLGLVGSRAHFRPMARMGFHLGASLGELMAIKWSDKLRSKGSDVKVEVKANTC